MESRPTIRIQALRTQPEYRERLRNWALEVYYPLIITIPEYQGIDYFQTVKENPQYERTYTVFYYANRTDMIKARSNPKAIDISKDVATWVGRSEVIWFAAYELVRNFRNEETGSGGTFIPKVENVSLIQLEGYSLSPNDEEKFITWFAKWSFELYIPWLMKLPGLKEYSFYRLIDIGLNGIPDFYKPKRPIEYPRYLSILYFDKIESCENYENSIELAGFREAMKVPFPMGLDFKWYVKYQLLKSWRK